MHAPVVSTADRGRNLEETVERWSKKAFEQFAGSYDRELGGFGAAPKFPRPSVFSFLLGYYRSTGEALARTMTLESLERMWEGGIHDHLGGGFHRYSVDRVWRVPHFEKMLYDQAQLVCAFLASHQVSGEDFYAEAAREILGYVAQEMTGEEGGFYSAEDADSAPDPRDPDHRVEGAFYLWSVAEIEELLGEQAPVVIERYGLSAVGNTLSDPHGDFGSGNVLYAARSEDLVARQLGLSAQQVRSTLGSVLPRLLEARAKRPRPHLDDKVISSWNGMMISAFARAAVVLGETRYSEVAIRAARFVLDHCGWQTSQGDLRLTRRYRDGEAQFAAQLDDYAHLGLGLVDLYQATWQEAWLETASALAKAIEVLFSDEQDPAFFDSPEGDSSILVRTKEVYDGAEPSGNATASLFLLRLDRLTGRRGREDRIRRILERFAPFLDQQPSAAPALLLVAGLTAQPPEHLVIVGRPDEPRTIELIDAARSAPWAPNRELVVVDENGRWLLENADFLKPLVAQSKQPTAFFCRNLACDLPITEASELSQKLGG